MQITKAEISVTVNSPETLVEYLSQAVERHRRQCSCKSQEQFILEHGRSFTPQPYRLEDWRFKGAVKQCFANTYTLVRRHPDKLRYVEGYCIKPSVNTPILHAWAIDAQDRVIDPTLSGVRDYYGVVFDTGYVTRIRRNGRRGVAIIDNVFDGFPLLTGKHTDWMPKDT